MLVFKSGHGGKSLVKKGVFFSYRVRLDTSYGWWLIAQEAGFIFWV